MKLQWETISKSHYAYEIERHHLFMLEAFDRPVDCLATISVEHPKGWNSTSLKFDVDFSTVKYHVSCFPIGKFYECDTYKEARQLIEEMLKELIEEVTAATTTALKFIPDFEIEGYCQKANEGTGRCEEQCGPCRVKQKGTQVDKQILFPKSKPFSSAMVSYKIDTE